mmetsp:Transcript_66106/g.136966  ORF Transcript_66106/g.136966 Transcript_66106/m.136966 type:complete len:95 (+) Transcript_66106:1089-1373(+)
MSVRCSSWSSNLLCLSALKDLRTMGVRMYADPVFVTHIDMTKPANIMAIRILVGFDSTQEQFVIAFAKRASRPCRSIAIEMKELPNNTSVTLLK